MLASRRPDVAELFAALPVAVMVVDADGRVARVNAAGEALLNLSERVVAGRPLGDFLTPPAAPPGHDVAAFDLEIATPAGPIRVDLAEAMLADHPGWRVITLHPSASARRLAHSADRAAAARSAIGAAAMLAHEIKNPLSGIRGAAQLLAPHDRDLTSLIVTEVDRVAALIDRMEDFTDTRPITTEPLNIYPLLAHARDVARAGFARGIVWEERFDPSLPPAQVNRDALLQVILNLLKNAAEALGTRGERRITLATAYRHGVTVSAGANRPRRALPIEICVIDTGPGAPHDISDHLFDPFVSSRPEGKGLGLALVDKLVRGMGGLVQYAREGHPHCTVFRLLLPRGEA